MSTNIQSTRTFSSDANATNILITKTKAGNNRTTNNSDIDRLLEGDDDDDDIKENLSNEELSNISKLSPCDQQRQVEDQIVELQNEIRALYQSADYTGALEYSKQLLEVCDKVYGAHHPVTASSYNNVGLMNKQLGNYKEAIDAYNSALRAYADIVGKYHENYAGALHNLAICLRHQSMYDEHIKSIERVQFNDLAIEYLKEALEIRDAELGADHPYTISTRSNLGAVIASQVLHTMHVKKTNISKYSMSLWNTAEEHLRSSLDISIRKPKGEKIKQTKNVQVQTKVSAIAAHNLALFLKYRADFEKQNDTSTYNVTKSYQEAKINYYKALKVRKELYGDSHPDTLSTYSSLAELLVAIGDDDGANKIREDILKHCNVEEVNKQKFDELEEKHGD